jgi:acetyltransferase
MKADLFFDARTIAVIGAAREEHKVGHIIFKNLLQSRHIRVFPVNPNAETILGQRCYKDIFEIPYDIDCLVIAIKAELVADILKEAHKKRVNCAIIISSGFKENGNPEAEEQIKKIAEKSGIEILGPNVLGVINPYKNINASFFEGMPEKGKIAFLSQSGAIGTALLDMAIKEKIGLSGFVSLGNMAMLDFSDFIEHFAKDEKTKMIALYLESLPEGKGRRFIEVCKKISKIKPIIAIKAGKTKKGAEAAKTHTAALASERGVYEGVFKQAGIIEVNNLNEIFSISNIFSKIGWLGKKACIITNSGGLGVLCSDCLTTNKIEIPQIPENIKAELNKILPKEWSHNNPIDVLGDALADRYHKTIKLLENEKFFDFFIILLTPQYMTQPLETAKTLIESKKPVIACFAGGRKVDNAVGFLNDKIPVFPEVQDIANALGKLIAQ